MAASLKLNGADRWRRQVRLHVGAHAWYDMHRARIDGKGLCNVNIPHVNVDSVVVRLVRLRRFRTIGCPNR